MTEPERIRCVICAKRDPEDGWTICRGCLNRTDDDLAAILILTGAAAQYVSSIDTALDAGYSAMKPTSRPPIDLQALDDAQGTDALALCESWERLCREFYGLSPYGPVSSLRGTQRPAQRLGAQLDGSIGFLRSWLARIAETADFPIDEMAAEIKDQRQKLNRYDDDREEPGWRVACPSDHPDGDGRLCGWRLRIVPHSDDVIVCRACGTHWTAQRLLMVGLATDIKVWLTEADVVAWLQISKPKLRQWVKLGYVERRGTLYAAGDALATRAESEA